MDRYRATITFLARSDVEARAILPKEMIRSLPEGTSLQIENLRTRRTLRQALFLAAILLFWYVLGSSLAERFL